MYYHYAGTSQYLSVASSFPQLLDLFCFSQPHIVIFCKLDQILNKVFLTKKHGTSNITHCTPRRAYTTRLTCMDMLLRLVSSHLLFLSNHVFFFSFFHTTCHLRKLFNLLTHVYGHVTSSRFFPSPLSLQSRLLLFFFSHHLSFTQTL